MNSLSAARETALVVFDSFETKGFEYAVGAAVVASGLPAATVRRAIWERTVAAANAAKIARRAAANPDVGSSYFFGCGIRRN